MRPLALILPALLLSAAMLLTGCGASVSEVQPEAEPEPTPEPVYAYTADFSEVGNGLSSLVPLCAVKGGFYCCSYEKTGEEIPEAVIREAKWRNVEVVNDGRYDICSFRLYFLSDDGSSELLKEFTPLAPEENADGWKSWSCISGIEALSPDKDGNLVTLEYNTFSGNSVPANRAEVVPGKNYLEYHTVWYIRTLDTQGKELKSERIGENAKKAESRFRVLTRRGNLQEQLKAEETPFSFEELGIDRSQVLSPVKKDEYGKFRFVTGEGKAESLVTVSLEEVKQERTQILVAGLEESEPLKNAVSDFNASQEDVSVTIITPDDERVANADIFCLPSAQISAMGREGKLADLYPYLDADPKLDREDFFASALQGMELDGALISTGAGMSFETVIGASSLVGEKAGWTYDDFTAAWSALGLGTDAFDVYTTCEDVLDACLALDLDTFIDRKTASCDFTGENFRKLLYFTGNFRRDFDYDGHGWSEADHSDLRIRREKQMLLEKNLTCFRDVLACGCEFPEEITFIGYPTLGQAGSRMILSTFEPGLNLAMSALSEKKDDAWRFLRTFFTEEYQESYWYFPTNIHVFNRELEKAMETEEILDGNGKPVYDRETGEPAVRSVGTMYLSNFVQVELYPLTEPEAGKLVDLINESSKTGDPDEEICSIVKENVKCYYDGEASLEEAAARAQQAVSEHLTAS